MDDVSGGGKRKTSWWRISDSPFQKFHSMLYKFRTSREGQELITVPQGIGLCVGVVEEPI